MLKTVVAIFDNRDYAENAAKQIKDLGLKTFDISIIAKDNQESTTGTMFNNSNLGGNPTAMSSVQTETNATNINDNVSDGVITGGVLGGLAGLLIGAGSMMVPGLGIIAAAGPITGFLSGTISGGIVGGLIDLGIPERQSKTYENDIKEGKFLFSMSTDETKVQQLSSLLTNSGAVSVDSY